MTGIRIGDRVIATEHDMDAAGHDAKRHYRGVVIGINHRRRWALVAYRCGGACLRGGFAFDDIRVLGGITRADRIT